MPKSNSVPPAIFQVLKKSSSNNSGDSDDDRATLIPSFGSSFNLSGDSAVLKKNCSQRSGGSKRKNKRHNNHAGSRDKESSRASHQAFSISQVSRLSSTSGSSSNAADVSFRKQDSMPDTPSSQSSDLEGKYKRQNTDPLQGCSKESRGEDTDSAYFLYDERGSSDNIPPYVKSSQSLEIPFNKLPSEKRQGYLDNVPESGESIRSSKSNKSLRSNALSEASEKSRKSASRSVKSAARRKKFRREERVREWERKRLRRKFLGKVTLTVISVLLGAYTLLVTAGPLVLHFIIDPVDWCPFHLDDGAQDFYQMNGATENDVEQTVEQTHRRRSLKTSGDIHSIMHENSAESNEDEETHKYENPDYDDSPCRLERLPQLLYLTLEECDLSRRMASSVLFGGFIGYERRASDRPAGIRTMALVSLGSCFFTLSSQLAFRDSPMGWDSSRVSAAIPSGVGFLGAGLIWKGTLSDSNGVEVHQVHGITTAASVWLAAAVGVGAGGALYAVTAYSTALVILVLRFGPRLYFQHDRGFDYEEDDDEYDDDDDKGDGNIGDELTKESMPKVSHHDDGESGLRHRPSNYEMHQIGESTQNVAKGYGSTDSRTEEDIVAQLLQEDRRRQLERLNNTQSRLDSSVSQSTSWLSKLLPWKKERAQPENPYHALMRDRDLLRLMSKKKSMNKMNSRPSFCT